MILKDLKKSLSQFPPDMDDMEIIVKSAVEGDDHFEALCYVGYLPLKNNECLILGSYSSVVKMAKDGDLPEQELPPE